MKIFLREIPDEGLDVSEDIAPEVIDIRDEDGFHFTEFLKVKAHLDKVDDALIASIRIRSRAGAVCGRCLEETTFDWTNEMTLDFPIEPGTEFIDMTEEIRQEVILSFPGRVLCKDDCKGICAGCGVNLNHESCRC